MSNVTRLPDLAHLSGPSLRPTCPPPMPPAPLTPPSLASTGTGDTIAFPSLVPATDAAPSIEQDAPALRVVPRPRPGAARAARAPFVTLVLLLLGGGLVSLLLINTALSQGAFAVQKLQQQNLTLTEQQQELDKSLADADQPQTLAHKAVQLGMVPGGAPAFLHLPDGKVAGTPAVATSPPPPAPPAPTTTSAAATSAPAAPTTAGTPTAGTPVTSAPVTSAPVTSAPVTTAPAAGTTAPPTPTAGRTTPSKGKP